MIDTQGKLLVAPPNMTDWRFQKSVVYIWKHDVSGAAGCIINKRVKNPLKCVPKSEFSSRNVD